MANREEIGGRLGLASFGKTRNKLVGRGRRALFLLTVAAGALAPALILLVMHSGAAYASATVQCNASAGILTITVNGGSSADSIVVTTGGGTYGISLDSASTCPGQDISDQNYPEVQFSESPAVVPAIFRPGTDSKVTFVGPSGPNNAVDLTTEPATNFSSFSVAMTASASPCAGSAAPGSLISTGSSILDDCFGNVSIVDGATSVPTTFDPGTVNGVNFVGGSGSGTANTLDLTDESAAEFGSFTVAVSGGAGACTGAGQLSSSGGSTNITDCFSNVTKVRGATAVPTDFQPGTATLVDFIGGTGTGTTNTLDLRSESATNFSSFAVAMTAGSGSCSGSSEVSGAGSVNIDDCFSNVSIVEGASSLPTLFQPGTVNDVTFDGGSGSEATNTLDLGSEPSGSFSALSVNMSVASGKCSGSGSVTSSGGSPDITDCFSNVSTVQGAASLPTTFQPGTATGVSFIGGSGSNATNTLDLGPESAFTALTVNMSAGSGQCSGSASVTSSGGSSNITDCFSNVSTVKGSTSVPTTFQPGTASGISFVGGSGSGTSSTLDLTPESSSSFSSLAVNMSVGSGPCAGSGDVTSSGGTSIVDCFSNVSTVEGASSVATTFKPGTATGVSFVGGLGSGVVNTLDLTSESAQSFSSLTVAENAPVGPCAGSSIVTSSGGSPNISDCFSNVALIDGAQSVPTAWEPGTITGVTFTGGTGTGVTNTLDLSGEPAANFKFLTVAMTPGSQPCGALSQVSGSGTSTITDCFSNVSVVDGATSVATSFQPGNASGVTFDGGSGATNTLDLTGESASKYSSFSVGMTTSAGSCSGSGSVSSQGGSSNITDCFADVSIVDAPPMPTTFQPGNVSGVDFVGASGATNTLDLSREAGSASQLTVKMSGDSAGVPGTLSGTSGAGATIGDSFSSIQTVIGSPKGTTFEPGSIGGVTFSGSSAGTATVNLNGEGTGDEVIPAGDSVAAPGSIQFGGGLTDSFSEVTAAIGSDAGQTTFVAGSGSTDMTMTGQGSGNALDLSQTPSTATAPAIVDIAPASGSGTVSTSSEPAGFSDMQTFTGPETGNATFIAGNVGGLSFQGQGPGNTLSFQDVPATGSVQVSLNPNAQGLETAQPGSGTDTFTGFQGVDGSPGNDTFTAGPGNWTLHGGGGSDTLSEAAAPNPANVSFNNGVAAVTGPYSGTTSAAGIATFVGSAVGGNKFAADRSGGYTFQGQGAGNVLDGSSFPSAATVDAASGSVKSLAAGLGNSTTDSFSGITQFVGSSSGSTTFVARAAGGLSFSGHGSGNALDFGSAPSGLTVDPGAGSASNLTQGTGGSMTDSFSGVSDFLGSDAGSTTFVAPAGGGYGFGGTGPSNELDAGAFPSGAEIDASNGTASGLSGGLAGATTDSLSGISTLIGSTGGNTHFAAPSSGGLTFDGQGSGNSLDGSAFPSAAVFEIGSGTVKDLSGAQGPTTDIFSGITRFTGSSNGSTTFVAAPAGGLSFKGQGASNQLDFGAAAGGITIDARSGTVSNLAQESGGSTTDSFSGVTGFLGSSAGGTTFVAANGGGYTFSGAGQSNSLDGSALPSGAVLDIATGSASKLSAGVAGVTTDSFSGISSFVGSGSGSTQFVAATAGGYTFTGQGGKGNVLNIGLAPASATVDQVAGLVHGLSAGLAGSTADHFGSIQGFSGVPSAIASSIDDAASHGAWTGKEVAGSAAYDSALLTGSTGLTPAGTVTYSFFRTANCSGIASAQRVMLTAGGNVPGSASTGALTAGSYSYAVSFSGTGTYRPATGACAEFAVKLAPVVVKFAGPKSGTHDKPVKLSATLATESRQPIAGRTLLITVGSGKHAQACVTDDTNSKGQASCRIAKLRLAPGKYPVTVSFHGDVPGSRYDYAPGSGTGSFKVRR